MLVVNKLLLLLNLWKVLVVCHPSEIYEEPHSYRDYEGITQHTFGPLRDFPLYKMPNVATARSIPIYSPHSLRQDTHKSRSAETHLTTAMEKHVSYKVLPNPDLTARDPLHLPQPYNQEDVSQITGKQKMNFPGHMRTYRMLSSEASIQQHIRSQDSLFSESDIKEKLPLKHSTRSENPEYKATQQTQRTTTPKQEYNHYKTTQYLRKRPAATHEKERLHVTVRSSGASPSSHNKTFSHKVNSSLQAKYDQEYSGGIEFFSTEHVFTQAEESCFQQGKVLFEKDGICYKLLEVGPCNRERQEWLVLDKDLINKSNGRLRAVCQHCPCCDKDFRAVFWPGDGQCHHLLRESSKLCPLPGTTLQIDPFGEGECECTKDPPHAHLESDDSEDGEMLSCYPLYRRGPCALDHILVQSDHRNVIKKAHCIRDPCASYNAQNQKHNQSISVWWEGECYRLGTKGPCKRGDATYNIHPVSHKPACISRTNNIVELPERCASETEKENAECQKEVILPTEEQYIAELLHSAEKKRRRRRRTNK